MSTKFQTIVSSALPNGQYLSLNLFPFLFPASPRLVGISKCLHAKSLFPDFPFRIIGLKRVRMGKCLADHLLYSPQSSSLQMRKVSSHRWQGRLGVQVCYWSHTFSLPNIVASFPSGRM